MTPRLMRISEAAHSVGITPRALRTEIAKGRLLPTRIAGKIYLTDSQLQAMIEACRDQPKGQGSTSSATPAGAGSGSSATPAVKSARAAARATLEALKKPLAATSPRSTRRHAAAD